MIICALDPGNIKTGWMELNSNGAIGGCCGGVDTNEEILEMFRDNRDRNITYVCEQMVLYGVSGHTIADTLFWTGRFYQALQELGYEMKLVTRATIKAHICGTSRVGDKEIKDALVHRFGPPWLETPPGSKKKRIPGPTNGITSHMWAALAVAVTYYDQSKMDPLAQF